MANTNIILKQGDTLNVSVAPPVTSPVNQLPIVSTGPDKTIKLPVSEVTLTGQSSDPDNDVLAYQWAKIAGGAAVIASPTALTTKITGLSAVGTYSFRLTVNDGKGGTASDTVDVFVQAADVVVIPPTGGVKYLQLPKYTGPVNDDIVITRQRIGNQNGVSMNLVGRRNIRFVECWFDYSLEEAISFENSNGLTAERCLFSRNQSAIYGLNSSNIKMIDCQVINQRQRPGGSRGQMLQGNSCNQILIENCRSEGFDGESSYEDHISFYNSNNCTARGNKLRGGGPSNSGSGIMTGDNGGSTQLVENNILHRTGNAGIGVAGGNDIKILNNKIFSERTAVSNNPLYAWNQSGKASSNVVVKGNRSTWTDKGGNNNGGWDGGGITNLQFEYPTPITLAELGMPVHLIDFVTEAELLTIRK